MATPNLPGQELIDSLSKLMEKAGVSSIDDLGKSLQKKQGNVDFLSLISKASPYLAIGKTADSLIAAFSGKTLGDTGTTGLLSSVAPGLTSIFSTKIKKPTIEFKPNSSYTSTFKDVDKLNNTSNKYYLPWEAKKYNTQIDNYEKLFKTADAIKKDNDLRKLTNPQDVYNKYLNTINSDKLKPTAIGRKGLKLFSDDLVSTVEHLKTTQVFQNGGKMNVIPDGALHARKHTIDDEELNGSITNKGIPIISKEDGGEVVQHAEIERDEIIFTLEVTKKLEELSKKGTDEAAIEAGKLLVEEILFNTDDRTGLINTIE